MAPAYAERPHSVRRRLRPRLRMRACRGAPEEPCRNAKSDEHEEPIPNKAVRRPGTWKCLPFAQGLTRPPPWRRARTRVLPGDPTDASLHPATARHPRGKARPLPAKARSPHPKAGPQRVVAHVDPMEASTDRRNAARRRVSAHTHSAAAAVAVTKAQGRPVNARLGFVQARSWGVAPGPSRGCPPLHPDQRGAGPKLEELRSAQFLEQARSRPAATLPTETAARLVLLAPRLLHRPV